ncbi:MAG: pentapeptide repeat-containing protein [Bacteroidota bacterium]
MKLLFSRTFWCWRRRHVGSALSGSTLTGASLTRTTLTRTALAGTTLTRTAHRHPLHFGQRFVEFLQAQYLDTLIKHQIHWDSRRFNALQIHLQRCTNHTAGAKHRFYIRHIAITLQTQQLSGQIRNHLTHFCYIHLVSALFSATIG